MGSMLSSVVPETDIEGYHILHVVESSPAQKAGLEAFFEFIVAICGVVLVGNHDVFMEVLQRSQNKPIELKIYSLRTNMFRNVSITPNNNWNGKGLLGLTINFCSVKEALASINHVLEIQPNSPAHSAGFRPFSDYIYGSEISKESEDLDFLTLVKEHDQKELRLFVYNHDDDACRSVLLKPNSQWGGLGELGCGIGKGYLHRIPTSTIRKRSAVNDEAIEKKVVESETTFVSCRDSPNLNSDPRTSQDLSDNKASRETICKINIETEVKEKPEKSSTSKTPSSPQGVTFVEEKSYTV